MRTFSFYWKSWICAGISILFVLIALNNPVLAQDNAHNYMLSRTYKVPLKDATVPVSVGEAILSLGYFDGLGRLQQTVNVQAGKDKKDLVAPIEYDAVGRLSKTYLPVSTATQTGTFQPIAASLVTTFYNNSARFVDPTDHVYAEAQYEASPLNRSVGQIAAGATTSTSLTYGVNDAFIWIYQAGSGLTDITRIGYYLSNQLTVIQAADEDGKLITEFKDKDGRLILRRAASNQNKADTYYVYDDLDQLRAVIQPLYDAITNPTPASDLPKYAFLYLYDGRGRLVQKQVPAGGLTQMQYNDRDLLISSTDAKNQQFYYNYDELNRQTEMGVCIGTCYPLIPANKTNKNPLKYTYYDSYESLTPLSNVKLGDLISGNFGFTNVYGLTTANDFVPADIRNANRKEQRTGECVRFLNADGSLGSSWNCSATYYDDRYRVVQTVRNLPTMGSNGLERISYKRDFSGKVLAEKTTQSWNSQSYSLERTFTYDHAERLTATRYNASSSDGSLSKDIYVNGLGYNEVGQLTDKYLNATDATGTGAIEHLTYKNNVRGWLRENKGIQNASRPFQLTLSYQNNGNIASQSWRHPSMSQAKTYQFSYDVLNRMSDANEGLGGGLSEAPTYDLNGNILSLIRRDAGGTLIDQLSYLYYGNNMLKSIFDVANNPAGFNNGYTGDDYSYDQNGNMLSDWNRNISQVDYNYLNLPRRVTINGKTLDYLYDAAGTKHSLTVGPTSQTLTSYEGIFEYNTSGLPTRISTDEGQLVKIGSGWQWQYYLKDHLGNVRIVLNEAGAVVQETEYYPFGLAIPKNPADPALSRAQNKYLYLNRELQEQTGWLDLKARFYDPAIGRFLSVDPMTDSQENLSPYHYGFNNPIRFSDPNGLIGDDCCGPGKSNLIRSDATSVAKRLSNIPNSGQSSSNSSALTVSVSLGKQVALEVAGIGFEVNFGSKEVFKMTEEVSSKDKIAGSSKSAIELDPSISKGFSVDIGVASLGQETKTKEITTMTSISGTNLKLPTTQTVTEKTGSIGVGLGKSPIGGSLEGGKTTTSYLGGQSKTEHTSGSLKGSYSTILPGYGGKTKSGIEFSIGIGYKIDVKVDPVQATKNFLGIK